MVAKERQLSYSYIILYGRYYLRNCTAATFEKTHRSYKI